MRRSTFEQAFGLGALLLSNLSSVAAVPFHDEKLLGRAAVNSPTIKTSSSASQTISFSLGSKPTPPPTATPVVSDATRPTTDHRKPPPSTVTVNRAAMTPYLYGCDKTETGIVRKAWAEARTLADAHAKWKPPGYFSSGSYQPAMDMYLGTDSTNDGPWFGTGPLKQNINRQQGIHTSNSDWSPYWSYAYIYCDESKVPNKPDKPKKPQCGSPNNPGKKVMAYTFPDDGSVFGWNAKYIVLCQGSSRKIFLALSNKRPMQNPTRICSRSWTPGARYMPGLSSMKPTTGDPPRCQIQGATEYRRSTIRHW